MRSRYQLLYFFNVKQYEFVAQATTNLICKWILANWIGRHFKNTFLPFLMKLYFIDLFLIRKELNEELSYVISYSNQNVRRIYYPSSTTFIIKSCHEEYSANCTLLNTGSVIPSELGSAIFYCSSKNNLHTKLIYLAYQL